MEREEAQELAGRLIDTAEEFEKCSPSDFVNPNSYMKKRSRARDDAARALIRALRLLEANCTYKANAQAIYARVAAYEATVQEITAGESAPEMDVRPGEMLIKTARLYAAHVEGMTAEREKPAADVRALLDHANAAAKQSKKLLNAYRFGLDDDKIKAWKVAAQALADDLQELYSMLPPWGRDVLPGTHEPAATASMIPRKGEIVGFLMVARDNKPSLPPALDGMVETLAAVEALLVP